MKKQLDDKDKWTEDLGLNFDERIAGMEKADSEGKLTDYMILQLLTGQEKTEEQYLKLLPWLDKIKADATRREMTAYFWFLRTNLAIKEKRFVDAEKFTAKVPRVKTHG